MLSLQRCVVRIGFALAACAAVFAAPPLTVVQDILYNADSTPFQGSATITWPNFEASDTSMIAGGSITTNVVNGFLRVQLTPTTNALSPASYTVVFTPTSGSQFIQIWAVPSIDVPVSVSAVSVTNTGTVVSGGGGTAPPANDTSAITMAQITGLQTALSVRPSAGPSFAPSSAAIIDANGLLESAMGNASDCVHVDGSSGACGGGLTPLTTLVTFTFVDSEVPQGALNGTNTMFLLGNAPQPSTSLMLFHNGLLLRPGLDYTLSGSTITFNTAPQSGDGLLASYRVNATLPGVTFVDGEVPSGAVNGSNTVYTLANTPVPVSGAQVYRNGLRMRQNLDYTITGNTITFIPAQTPQSGDVLLCSYRM